MEYTNEKWLPIAGYEGLYEVSSEGRVRSLARDVIMGRGGLYHLPQQLLKPTTNSVGYLQVYLCKDGKPKWYRLHRLVAEAFLPNPKGLLEVNHIDEDKTNNAVNNLEWCDRLYNVNYGTGIARHTAAICKPVQQLSKDGVLITVWPSLIEAWRQTGINYSSISSCCKDKYRTADGYIWKYVR